MKAKTIQMLTGMIQVVHPEVTEKEVKDVYERYLLEYPGQHVDSVDPELAYYLASNWD